MSLRSRTAYAMAVCLAVTACAETTTRQKDAAGDASGTRMTHVPLALGQVATAPQALAQPMPEYPPALVASRLPSTDVEARIVVDARGQVTDVAIAGDAQADAVQRAFNEAVRNAVMRWTFTPAQVSRFAADANGNPHEVDSEARPFTLAYRFRFAWRENGPVVDAVALAASP